MKYSLYGNEIDDTTNPFEAGLGWVVKPAAKDFIGKQKMLSSKQQLQRKLVGFRMIEKGIPRHGYKLKSSADAEIGHVTSGTHSPSLNTPIGIGYVSSECSELGSEIFVDIRGRNVRAEVVKTPFIKK
jgi:aminomethyltransferase